MRSISYLKMFTSYKQEIFGVKTVNTNYSSKQNVHGVQLPTLVVFVVGLTM